MLSWLAYFSLSFPRETDKNGEEREREKHLTPRHPGSNMEQHGSSERDNLFCKTKRPLLYYWLRDEKESIFSPAQKKNNTKQNIFYGSFSDTLFSSIPSAQQESLSAQNSFFLVPSVFRTSSQTFLTFLFVSNWHTAVATNNSLDSLLLTVIDITIKLKLLYNVGERKMKETNGDRMRSEFVSFISLFVRVERRGKCAISFRR